MASWLMRLPSKSYSVHFILGLILTYFYFNYRFHVPVVMYVLLSLHNLLLVVNSSVNFIIYCCVGKRFRQELKLMLTPYCNFVCHCICNDQKDQADAEDPVPCQFWSLLKWNICTYSSSTCNHQISEIHTNINDSWVMEYLLGPKKQGFWSKKTESNQMKLLSFVKWHT